MATNQPIIHSEKVGNGVLITLMRQELLEEGVIASLEQSLLQTVNQADVVNFALNFEHVGFLSSAVLRSLIKVNTAVNNKDGNLILCSINSRVFEVFKITHLDNILDIRDDVESALASFQEGA